MHVFCCDSFWFPWLQLLYPRLYTSWAGSRKTRGGMYYTSELIPAKFLILVAHFIICVLLLWNTPQSVRACLTEESTEEVYQIHHTQLVVGLSVAIGMICFEMLIFIIGLTMFHTTSALLSIGCHAGSCILLTYIILDSWQCGWFWWIFSFGSVLPIVHDLFILVDELSVTRPSWTKVLVIAGVSTTIGCSMPVGYNIGVVNSPASILKKFCNESFITHYHSHLSEGQLDFLWSTIVSIFLVGGTIGSLCGSVVADKVGRRGALIVSSFIAILAGLSFGLSKTANSVEMLIIGRLLIGIASGLITSVMPMYLTELAPKNLRGSMGVLCPLGVTFGVLVGQVLSLYKVLGNEDYWPYLLAFYVAPVIFCASALFFLPESPKYLFVIKKLPHLALKQLSIIRNVGEEFLDGEIQELRLEEQDNDVSDGETWNIIRVLRDKSLRLPLLLVCSLQAGQQFSGINSVFYYSVSIFEGAGLSTENSQLATIAAGCCNLLMAIISIPVMAKFNRRSTLQLSLITTAPFLMLLGAAVLLTDTISWMPYFSIVGVLGFVICYGIALGPIPYFVGSELFEVGPRPSAMAMGSMANWGGNFVIGLCFPTMNKLIGAWSFFIFAAVVIALLFFVRFYLPETRGREISDIAILCRKGFASRPLASPVNSSSTAETFTATDLKQNT